MPTAANALLRWSGILCLAIASGMLIWGRTILTPHLDGLFYRVYWIGCLSFSVIAITIALLDIFVVRQWVKYERRLLAGRIRQDLRQAESGQAIITGA